MPPKKAEQTKSDLILCPHSSLAICGTIRPIKPISPANEITLDAVTDAKIMHTILRDFILTPNAEAVLSPRHKSSILFEIIMQIIREAPIKAAGAIRFLYCTPTNEPMENAL